jgi:hypothetical protein
MTYQPVPAKPPKCSTPGCENVPLKSNRFCAACQLRHTREGWRNEQQQPIETKTVKPRLHLNRQVGKQNWE